MNAPYPGAVLEPEASLDSVAATDLTEEPFAAVVESVEPTQDVLQRLRAKVAGRKAAGEYPSDLPERMAAHFERLLGGRGGSSVDFERVHAALDEARSARLFALEHISHESNLPGGTAAHKLIGKVTARQSQGVLQQLQTWADATQRSLDVLAGAIAQLQGDLANETRGLDEQIARAQMAVGRVESALPVLTTIVGEAQRSHQDLSQSVARLVASSEATEAAEARRSEHLDQRLAEIELSASGYQARIERLERTESGRDFRPWFDLARFEARFRGTRTEILGRYHDVGRLFVDGDGKGLGTVLDIGCGRGEFLEVLRAWGVDAYGVEVDPSLVAECQTVGLRATLVDDGLAHLAALGDGSLGGIVLIQVIEHLSQQHQLDLVALAIRKLKPGGRFVVESVNATSLFVYANSMYLDPTHTRPVHPAYFQFLCDEIGFETVELEYRSPVPDSARLPLSGPKVTGALKDGFTKLDALLHGAQDYLVVATK